MLTRILTVISVIALAVVFAAPVAADENTPAALQDWGSASVCDLEKVDTWSQQFDANTLDPQFQTVTFGNAEMWQHFEPYTAPGVRTVSWVLPPREPATMTRIFGGSIWQGQCGPEGFDYVRDAANYSIIRAGDGHSGIVVVVPPVAGEACMVIDTTLTSGSVVSQERLDYINLLLTDQIRHMSVPLCPNLTPESWSLNLVGWSS